MEREETEKKLTLFYTFFPLLKLMLRRSEDCL